MTGPRMDRWLVIAAGAGGSMLVPQVQAEWDAEKYLVIPVGGITLRPTVEVAEIYDSNVFYSETDEQSDLITSVRPGLSMVYGSRSENFISLTYQLEASAYMERDDLNNIGHRVLHQSRFKFSRLTIEGEDRFAYQRTLLGGTFSYIERQVGQLTLTDNWKADYDLSPKAILGVRALFDMVDYDEDDLQPYHLYDYRSFGGGARFGYRPSDKITVFPEVMVGRSALEANSPTAAEAPDLTAYSFGVGAEGEFTPKLTGQVAGGYEMREYSDGSDVPAGWTANVALRWQPRVKTAVQLSYRHWVQASREAVAFVVESDRLSLSLAQDLGTQGRWTTSLDLFYQFEEYSNEFFIQGLPVTRENDLAGVSFRTRYRWSPWLTTVAGYDFFTYGDNISTIPDYDVHRFSLRLVAGY